MQQSNLRLQFECLPSLTRQTEQVRPVIDLTHLDLLHPPLDVFLRARIVRHRHEDPGAFDAGYGVEEVVELRPGAGTPEPVKGVGTAEVSGEIPNDVGPVVLDAVEDSGAALGAFGSTTWPHA